MPAPRLVAFDLDDTLAPSKSAIDPRIGDLLIALAEHGDGPNLASKLGCCCTPTAVLSARTSATPGARRPLTCGFVWSG